MVFRVEKTKDYTILSNAHFREKEMSLKAKGLLSLMLSLPDEWDYSVAGLVEICKENESAIKSTLKELQKFGYLEIKKMLPNETKSGRIEYVYDVCEQPRKKQGAEKQGVEKQGVENQPLENQPLEIQAVENQGQLNTNNKNTNNKNTNNKNIYCPPDGEPRVSESGYSFEKGKANGEQDEIVESFGNEETACEAKSREICDEAIEYLNAKIGARYKATSKTTQRHINARVSEGFTLDDLKTVIDKKCAEWLNTDMGKYLRPETLFGTKFESYLNAPATRTNKKNALYNCYDMGKDQNLLPF